jgi:hypothetical protein
MKKKERKLDEMRAGLVKEHGPEKAYEIEKFLNMLANIAVDIAMEEHRRQEKLKKHPNGFPMDKTGYSCTVCGDSASGRNSWFDSNGLKCGLCQDAIDQKEVPGWLGKRREDWYSSVELEIYFNLKKSILRHWVKKGLLVQKAIKDENGRVHLLAFLIEDNKEMLPPKDILKGGMIKEIVNGRDEYVSAPWYWFVDPKEHLKGYGIGEYLKLVPADRGIDRNGNGDV